MKKQFLCIATFFMATFSLAEINTEENNQIPSNGTDTTFISGYGFFNKQVTYEKQKDLAVLEGDIILGTIQEAEKWKTIITNQSNNIPTRSIIITGQRYRWPNNLIPYQFGSNVSLSTRNRVLNAMEHWRRNTAIEFTERTSNNASTYTDYVFIVSDENACWSYVGRRGGQQKLNLSNSCSFGNAVHEIGHTLGLWHEQSREDRDQYVQINRDNIIPGKEHNFNQKISDGDDVGEYDYGSIMHYSAYAFSSGGPTIVPLQSAVIGQRNGLSTLDIASINAHYPEIVPVAKLDKDSYSVLFGNGIFIDGRHSFDPNGDSLIYTWNLGDGAPITTSSAMLEYSYNQKGHYCLSLTVTDPSGNTDTDTASVTVFGYEDILPAINLLIL
ncbi:Dot/Icm T4SS effector Zinc-dependent metalloprotease LegP [Gynuella sunshinyii]|uniref:PKD domain-containing protein n=1 Tax=Gynuella sunshinyii YC6258 TaxID=1445510 RepID=A0A0C5VLA7_9GAMM|nr:Dot/Icm T4SS effector Zinc-dependent metalloprotease LegP [Gynuella sunshinyii]AJQ94133.1 hypothetical Protein YC6258_02091 [Gynuella sunshinyii YC6258]